MKHFISTLMFVLFSCTILISQRPGLERVAEKVEAQKIAFITNALNLTPEESQKFWPLYNEYSAKEKEL